METIKQKCQLANCDKEIDGFSHTQISYNMRVHQRFKHSGERKINCQCCEKEYTERDFDDFADKYTSTKASKQFGKLCWNCLIFAHPNLLDTNAPTIPHECGFKHEPIPTANI